MKICVLRRDGKDVHNGMVMVIPDIVVKFFGMKDVSIYKDKEEFTQMLVFEAGKEEESKIVPFIQEVSRINPLYAVRLHS